MAAPALDDDEFSAWFRLAEAPGVGRATARALLASFGSPEAVMTAGATRLRQVAGEAAAQALTQFDAETEQRLIAALAWRDAGAQRHMVVLGAAQYPAALLQTADPPLLLYVQGDPAVLAQPALAIVGSRSPTAQGADNARQFARHFSQAGLVVVSGLALGVDGAAHDGALAGPTPTIAVVGTGLDRVYPARHRHLAHRIAEHGAVVSEFAPGMAALRQNFPQRNRIIAGMALGTLVVEAALQSGSLITARLAAEAGREVFAIPGSIHAPQSRGCHALIKQGAKLVESAADVMDELRWRGTGAATGVGPGDGDGDSDSDDANAAATHPDAQLLAAMGHDPVTLDVLGARTGHDAGALSARLLALELDGRVARLPGGIYQRRTQA